MKQESIRIYGTAPFHIVLIHGGPGAPGEMAPIAKKLQDHYGMLEPFQTKDSIDAQLEELHTTLQKYADLPVILVGFSWGALLSLLYTHLHPHSVQKLILIGSPPLEQEYAATIQKTRKNRMTEEAWHNLETIKNLIAKGYAERDILLQKIAELLLHIDNYLPLTKPSPIKVEADIFRSVWKEAEEKRKKGIFLQTARLIQCPIVVIHGEYDPHPFQGIIEPLKKAKKQIRTILLKECGHYPWIEKKAQADFYRALKKELICS